MCENPLKYMKILLNIAKITAVLTNSVKYSFCYDCRKFQKFLWEDRRSVEPVAGQWGQER